MRLPRPVILPTQPVTRAELAAAGVTPAMLRTQLGAGQLVRLHRGVFVAASHWPAEASLRHGVLARAEQARNPAALISHGSAATILGLPHPGPGEWWHGPVCMSVAGGNRATRDGVVYHQARVGAAQVFRDELGYRLTSVSRTAVDLAVGLELPEALVLLDAAARIACAQFVAQVRRQDYRNSRLVEATRELLADAARSRRAGRLLPAIALVEPCRESPIESLAAAHFHLAGLPTPLFQPAVRTPYGTFFPDCYWPDHHLIGEADGAVKYADPAVIVAEKQREQVLRDEGYRFVRWLGKEITYTPAAVVTRVLRALGAG